MTAETDAPVPAPEPDAFEGLLHEAGLSGLAQACHTARRSTRHDDPQLRQIQLVQIGLNVPILVLSSVALARVVAAQEKTSVQFSSRDCNLWTPLFARVAAALGTTVHTEYFYTSRLTRTRPSPVYLDYVRSRIDNAIVVDVCGSGWSLSHLAETLGMSELSVFFIHRLGKLTHYEEVSVTRDTLRFDAVVPWNTPGLDNTPLEMCNYAQHGMVLDVELVDGVPVPVLDQDDRTPYEMEAVQVQHHCFEAALAAIRDDDIVEVGRLDDAQISDLVVQLYLTLDAQRVLWDVYGTSHWAEEERVKNEALRAQESD